MTKISLKADKREIIGRKVKKLRQEGKVPANIFGKKIESQAIVVDLKEFEEVFEKAGETQIVDLNGKSVLISNVTYNPVGGNILHVDFRQVDLTEKITAKVPVETVGESPAEKQSLGTVVQHISELEVEALPADLPEKITVDASILTEVDQAVFVKDLRIPGKVEIKNDPEAIVVKVEPLQKEEEVVAPVEAAEAAPAEGQSAEASTEDAESPKSE